MPRGAHAQPECIHEDFHFLAASPEMRAESAPSILLSSQDAGWNARAHDVGPCWAGFFLKLYVHLCITARNRRVLCFKPPSFPQGIEKDDCNSGL